MEEERHKREEAEEKQYLPTHDDWTPEELWEKYEWLHVIDPDKHIHRPRERDKKITKHREDLKKTIDKILELGEDKVNMGHLDEATRKELAAHAIAKLVEEGYASVSKKGKTPEINEDTIKMYLQDAGIQLDYNELLKEIMNAGDLCSYENLGNTAPNLKTLLDHVSASKVEESRLIQAIVRTMQRVEHLNPIKKLAGEYLGTEFDPSATIQNVLAEHAQDVQEKSFRYDREVPSKTYKKKPTTQYKHQPAHK